VVFVAAQRLENKNSLYWSRERVRDDEVGTKVMLARTPEFNSVFNGK